MATTDGDFSPAFVAAVLGLAAFAWLEWLSAGPVHAQYL
jgi:hypothetical protein